MEFNFTLRLKLQDPNVDTDWCIQRLKESGCTDTLIGLGKPGVIAIQFTRKAICIESAIESAAADVRKAIPGFDQMDFIGPDGGRGIIKEAEISPCEIYRYSLSRTWDRNKDKLCFIMLNPSTADDRNDDPTIRRCISFAKRSNVFGGICVVNLFAYRATRPYDLKQAINKNQTPGGLYNYVVGPENDKYILKHALEAGLVVAAWGNHGSFLGRDKDVREMLEPHVLLQSIGPISNSGQPKHPLYLKSDLPFLDLPYAN